jgi:hypothetical protein
MSACPQCGFERIKTHRQLLALYRKHFGDIPVWDMIHRGWITAIDDPTESQTEQIVIHIRRELMRFFQMENESQLDGFMAGTYDPLVCLLALPDSQAVMPGDGDPVRRKRAPSPLLDRIFGTQS